MTKTMTQPVESAFATLSDTASRHYQLQRDGASVAELWRSRCELDDARLTAAKASQQFVSV